MKQRIQIFIEDELLEFTEEQAKKEGISRSALIRKAVLEYRREGGKDEFFSD